MQHEIGEEIAEEIDQERGSNHLMSEAQRAARSLLTRDEALLAV